MSTPIGVPFVAEVGPFLKGTKDVQGALADVGSSLDDLAHDADTDGGKVERTFKDMVTSAKQAADKLEREFEQTFERELPQSAKTGARKVNSAVDDIATGAQSKKQRFADIGQDIGGEFSANIGEGIGSNASGISGALDTILGTLGGVLPALGAAGAVAGVGALVVSSLVQGITANAAAATEAARKAGNAVADALRDGVLDSADKENIVMNALGVDDINDALPIIQGYAKATGLSVKQVYDAIASGDQAVGVGLQAVADGTSRLVGNAAARGADVHKVYSDTGQIMVDLKGKIDIANGAITDGKNKADLYKQAVSGVKDEWTFVGRAAEDAGRKAANAAKITADKRFLIP